VSSFYQEDDDMGFWENMGQEAEPDATAEPEAPEPEVAPAEPEATPEPEAEPEPQPESTDRPRGPDGKFIAKESEAAEPEAQEPAEPELIGGKFKNVDALLEAYQQVEREKGRLAEELGGVRQLIEERLPAQEPQQPSYDHDALADWFDQHPTQIPAVAAQAHREKNRMLYSAALAAWRDIDETGAADFDREVLKDELRAELQPAPAEQPWEATAREFAKQHPDFDQYATAMQEIAAEEDIGEIVNRTLEDGTPQAQLRVLSFLYREARGRETANLNATVKEVAREAAQSEQRAISEAAVASAITVQPDQPRKSAADLIGDEWEALERPRRDGWNI
jgi:hypothetical protein